MPTTGRPSAQARCSGPVSPPMHKAMRRVSAINSGSVAVTGTAAPLAAIASASASSPGPAFTRTRRPRSAIPSATAA